MTWRRTGSIVLAAWLAGCGSEEPSQTPPPCTDPSCEQPGETEHSLGVARVSQWRTQAGFGPLTADAKLQRAAQGHAKFVATTPQSCWPGSHDQVQSPSCPGFTGKDPGERMTAAGYQWATYLEAISFGDENVNDAIDGWLWTVYHRLVLFWPQITDGGFDCEGLYCVLKVGRAQGTTAPAVSTPAVFPSPDMTGVPKSWDGSLERPSPPAPSNGWPSGPVVSVHFPGTWEVTSATLRRTSESETLPIVLVTPQNDQNLANLSEKELFLYSESPLAGNTSHTVSIEGTFNGAAWSKSWSFTTTP